MTMRGEEREGNCDDAFLARRRPKKKKKKKSSTSKKKPDPFATPDLSLWGISTSKQLTVTMGMQRTD
jgi:hypothetical protein